MSNVVYKLFLDDFRMPIDCMKYKMRHMPQDRQIYMAEDWDIVRSYSEFVLEIEERHRIGEFPWIISFDHDLAHEHYGADPHDDFREKTGYDCAKWLLNYCIANDVPMPKFYVHSMNVQGAENIVNTLNDYTKYSELMRKLHNEEEEDEHEI